MNEAHCFNDSMGCEYPDNCNCDCDDCKLDYGNDDLTQEDMNDD